MRLNLIPLLVLMQLALLAPAVAGQSMDDKPRRYLVVQVEGAVKEWEVRPIRICDKFGGNLRCATDDDFNLKVDRWERTGLPRRYLVKPWKDAFAQYSGPAAPEGARFYFYAISPKQPLAEGKINLVDQKKRIYWVPATSVQAKAWPCTWVDLYEGYVGQFEGEKRQQAVKDWDAAHKAIIDNTEQSPDGFTPEERNEYARFYQVQFVYVRDRDPKLPGIYDELAAFHKARGNLDAELSVYLDGIRSGVASPHMERFQLAVGRIMVERLQLHEPALVHLRAAGNQTAARYLQASCLLSLGRTDEARQVLSALIGDLNNLDPAKPDAPQLELSKDDELGRTNLLLAEAELGMNNFAPADAALQRIPAGNPSYDAGRVLFAAMLLYRNQVGDRTTGNSDAAKAREALRALSFWATAQGFLNPKPDAVYPLNPLMARALTLYAQTDDQFRQKIAREGQPPKPNQETLRALAAAKIIDPLSAEPYVAEGRLYQRLGSFKEALAAYQAGLDLNPRDAMLNYRVADLQFKAGVLSAAKDYLGRCLKAQPEFYPALTRLGEIALAEIESIRANLLIKANAGEPVDYAGELVPPMKEAAAFFTASLTICPWQPATQLSLATLYLRLSETAPLTVADPNDAEELRRAYLSKARDLAQQLVDALREREAKPPAPAADDRDRAEVPSLAAFNALAFALNALGDIAGARAALEEHMAKSTNSAMYADPAARQDYLKSATLAYARDWLARINQNERQYFELVEFTQDSQGDFYGNWQIALKPKPDLGFQPSTFMKGGRLTLGVDQKESGVTSRIEIEKPHETLALFEAEFVRTGDVYVNRGIHLTKYSSGAAGSSPNPVASIMLGVDTEGRVYWETRRIRVDNAAKPEEQKDYGLVDVRLYGGLALNKDEKLTLALRRQMHKDMSEIEYVAVINGYEVKLPVTQPELKAQDLGQKEYKVFCGFYAQALAGQKSNVQVERARFVFDSGLAGKKGE
ncbi:MAG: hypothetical protein IT463_09150 [Planctomycetes bacterium]|nr:hypothetical protein [Planctomycetota bacterium]